MTRLGVWQDFRNPPRWRLPWQQLYRETLEQAVYAEELGFDSIWLSEHHFTTRVPAVPARGAGGAGRQHHAGPARHGGAAGAAAPPAAAGRGPGGG